MTQTLSSYKCSEGLKIKITSLFLDGKDLSHTIDEDQKNINLVDNPNWKEIRFRVVMSDPDGKLFENLRLSPIRESYDNVRACLRVSSAYSDFRRGFSLQHRGDTWEKLVKIEHKDVHSNIKLDGFLCRQSEFSQSSDDDYSTKTGHRLMYVGEDQYNWTINLDKSVSKDIGSLLKGEWVSFKKHERLKEDTDLDWYLDIYDIISPQLLLNSDSTEFQSIIDPRGSESQRASGIRMVIEDQIERDVKMQLILTSLNYLSSVESVEDSADDVRIYWQIMGWLRAKIRPHKEISEIIEEYSSQEDNSNLISQITKLLYKDTKSQKHWKKLIKGVTGD